MNEPKAQSKGKPKYTLAELLAASDYYSAPQPPEEREWVDAPAVGREIGSGEYEQDDEPPPNLKEVFEALVKNPLPEDFLLTDADRDRRPAQDRPELDKMFDALEDTGGAELADK